MLRRLPRPSGDPIAPRAIFARPIEYFSSAVEDYEDGLEPFKGVVFREGNGLYFELRAYFSHPAGTSTLYLQLAMEEAGIFPAIQHVAEVFELPWAAVIWHFGENVNEHRPLIEDQSRLKEQEARILVLKVASVADNLTADMETIREGVAKLYPLSRADRQRSLTRPAEQLWQQILRNVVSHRGGALSIFRRGLAEKVGNGIRITRAGVDYLRRTGFAD